MLWPRGKVLGGSSSLNAMMAFPGQAADYDGWAARGLSDWSWQTLAPLLGRVESVLAVE